MTSVVRTIASISTTFVAFGVLCTGAFAQAPDATLTRQQIYECAKAMYDRATNVYVKYESRSKRLIDLPTDDGREHDKRPMWVEFALLDGNRLLTMSRTSPEKAEAVTVFDGKLSHRLQGGLLEQRVGKRPDVEHEVYVSEALQKPYRDSDIIDYDNSWFYPHVLRDLIDTGSSYKVLPKQEQVDGVWCHVLEYPERDKLWVDASAGCVLRRRERRDGEADKVSLVIQYDFKNLELGDGGIWIPRTMIRKLYANRRNPPEFWNRLHIYDEVTVKDISINNIMPSRFDISIPPGTIIIAPSGENFRVPGNEAVALNALADKAKAASPSRSARLWIVWTINVGIFALVIATLWYWMRRRRSAA